MDASQAGSQKRGRSLDVVDKPGKRARFSVPSPGDDMELCDRPRGRFDSPPAAMELYNEVPEMLEGSTDSGR
jgi:hypothetical protein